MASESKETETSAATAAAGGAETSTEEQEAGTGSTSTASLLGSNIHVSNHPVLSHKITVMRSSSTKPAGFRASLREITFHLGYEATSNLSTRPIDISVPLPNDLNQHYECKGHKLKEKIALVPILRSGLGMVDSMLELIPTASVHHIGMYKRKSDSMPVLYYNRLPKKCTVDVAYVLDPIVGTAATIMSVIGILKKWGVPRIHVICVIASQKGAEQLSTMHPDVYVNVGVVDSEMSPEGYTLPGLGDSGDRIYNTSVIAGGADEEDDEEQSLLHISKRKKSDA